MFNNAKCMSVCCVITECGNGDGSQSRFGSQDRKGKMREEKKEHGVDKRETIENRVVD